MLELISKELQFSFDGKIQKLRYPTVMDMKKLNVELKKEDAGEIDTLVNMLVDLGMEAGIAEKLEVDHVNTIVQELTASKK